MEGLTYFNAISLIRDNGQLFDYLKLNENEILDWKDNSKSVESFFVNQIDIFDKGISTIKFYEENKLYLKDERVVRNYELLKEILKNEEPYKYIKDIPVYSENISSSIKIIVDVKRDELFEEIDNYKDLLSNYNNKYENTTDLLNKSVRLLDDIKEQSNNYKGILKIEGLKSQANDVKNNCIDNMDRKSIKPDIKESKTTKIKKSDLFTSVRINSQSDIEQFVDSVKKRLESELASANIIEFID
jgi:DNA-binding MltR family transcriptional regulator